MKALSGSISLITETTNPKSKHQTKKPEFSMIATEILGKALSGSSSLIAEILNQNSTLSMVIIGVNVDGTSDISSQVAEIVIYQG